MDELLRLWREWRISVDHLMALLRMIVVIRTLQPRDRRLGMLILNGHLWHPQFSYIPNVRRNRLGNRWTHTIVVEDCDAETNR